MSDDDRPADDRREPADPSGSDEAGPRAEEGESGSPSTDDRNWRFSLDDLADDGDESEGEGIAGAFGPSEEIEPGEIDRESVVFVLLGVTVAVIGLYLMVVP